MGSNCTLWCLLGVTEKTTFKFVKIMPLGGDVTSCPNTTTV